MKEIQENVMKLIFILDTEKIGNISLRFYNKYVWYVLLGTVY